MVLFLLGQEPVFIDGIFSIVLITLKNMIKGKVRRNDRATRK